MKLFFWNKKQLSLFTLFIFILVLCVSVTLEVLKKDFAITTMSVQPIYQGNTDLKSVAFEFNVDWGEENIPGILKILEEHKIKTTFFITGRFADKFPNIVKDIIVAGHEIGNHGYSHLHVDQAPREKVKEDILKTEQSLFNLSNSKTVLYAPPYGEHKEHVVEAAKEIGYQTIMWTIDTVDWKKSRSKQDIYNKVTKNITNGAIVLMHPTDRTKDALNDMIKTVKEQGFEIKKVGEIIK